MPHPSQANPSPRRRTSPLLSRGAIWARQSWDEPRELTGAISDVTISVVNAKCLMSARCSGQLYGVYGTNRPTWLVVPLVTSLPKQRWMGVSLYAFTLPSSDRFVCTVCTTLLPPTHRSPAKTCSKAARSDAVNVLRQIHIYGSQSSVCLGSRHLPLTPWRRSPRAITLLPQRIIVPNEVMYVTTLLP